MPRSIVSRSRHPLARTQLVLRPSPKVCHHVEKGIGLGRPFAPSHGGRRAGQISVGALRVEGFVRKAGVPCLQRMNLSVSMR
jgi:hypothetical protein